MRAEDTPAHVGERLLAARLERGLSQVEAARRADVAPSYLSRVESGKVNPAFATVEHIAEALGVELAELLGDAASPAARGVGCPVTARGRCLIDVIASVADEEHYTPREVRLLRRFATWIKRAEPNRVRAIEVLLDDLSTAAELEDARRGP